MVYKFSKCTMSTSDGKFILYKNIRNSWKMCTDDQQNSEENAMMYKSQRFDELTGKIQFALRFKRGHLYYSLDVFTPAVEEGKLEMKETSPDPDIPDDGYWFEKVKGDEYYQLRAVSEPRGYLCVVGDNISTCPDAAKGSLRIQFKIPKKSESLV